MLSTPAKGPDRLPPWQGFGVNGGCAASSRRRSGDVARVQNDERRLRRGVGRSSDGRVWHFGRPGSDVARVARARQGESLWVLHRSVALDLWCVGPSDGAAASGPLVLAGAGSRRDGRRGGGRRRALGVAQQLPVATESAAAPRWQGARLRRTSSTPLGAQRSQRGCGDTRIVQVILARRLG
jgi:hypothetical protein